MKAIDPITKTQPGDVVANCLVICVFINTHFGHAFWKCNFQQFNAITWYDNAHMSFQINTMMVSGRSHLF